MSIGGWLGLEEFGCILMGFSFFLKEHAVEFRLVRLYSIVLCCICRLYITSISGFHISSVPGEPVWCFGLVISVNFREKSWQKYKTL